MSTASWTPSRTAAAVVRRGPTRTGVSWTAGSWLRKLVRMYSAISRATAHPSVSKRSCMPASTSCSRLAVESNSWSAAPNGEGASGTQMGLAPSAPSRGFTAPTHLVNRP
jgi:hypothetical protein